MTSISSKTLTHADYTVACICPMGVEVAPVKAMLDEVHSTLPTKRQQNAYILGRLMGHNLVVATLPEIGTNSAATVAVQLLNDFPEIRFGLLVGIGGGLPDEDEDEDDDEPGIRLGDVVISKPTDIFGGVVQYDLGKYTTDGTFQRMGTLNKPPAILSGYVQLLRADHLVNGSRVPDFISEMLQKKPAMEEMYSHPGAVSDILFQHDYTHSHGKTCRECNRNFIVQRKVRRNNNPVFHYGTIGSANEVVKDSVLREKLRKDMNLLCIEMEAAGLMDSFPCLVIRGICDYADSHKNKKWQPYASAAAAAYMKELLAQIPPSEINRNERAIDLAELGNRLITQMQIERDKTAGLLTSELSDLARLDKRQMERNRFLNSLKYPAMLERENEINVAHSATHHWLFHPEVLSGCQREYTFCRIINKISFGDDSFHCTCVECTHRSDSWAHLEDWLESGDSFYWITGKAGSGKSTLMKALSLHPRTAQLLQTWQPSHIICRHFFWKNGSQMQKSFKGLLLSLLYQCLCADESLLDALLTRKSKLISSKDSDTDWSIKELLELLVDDDAQAVLSKACLFIDGLDSLTDEDALTLLNFLYKVRSTSSWKVCASSRKEPLYELKLSGYPTLQVQEFTHCDMVGFILVELRESLERYDKRHTQLFAYKLARRADGVFLWLCLTISRLQLRLNRCATVGELYRLAQNQPKSLPRIYPEMWSRIVETGCGQDHIAMDYLTIAVLNKDCATKYSNLGNPILFSALILVAGKETKLQPLLWMSREDFALWLGNREVIDYHKKLTDQLVSCAGDITEYCAGLLEVHSCQDDSDSESEYGVSDDLNGFNDIDSSNYCIVFTHKSAFDFLVEHDSQFVVRQIESYSLLRRWINYLRGMMIASRISRQLSIYLFQMLQLLETILCKYYPGDAEALSLPEVSAFWDDLLEFFLLQNFKDDECTLRELGPVYFFTTATYPLYIDFIVSKISLQPQPALRASQLLRNFSSWICNTSQMTPGQNMGPETKLVEGLITLGANPHEKGITTTIWSSRSLVYQFASGAIKVLSYVLYQWNGCQEPISVNADYNISRVQHLLSVLFANSSNFDEELPLFYQPDPCFKLTVTRPSVEDMVEQSDDTESIDMSTEASSQFEENVNDVTGPLHIYTGNSCFKYTLDHEHGDIMNELPHVVIVANIAFVIQMIAKRIAVDMEQPTSMIGRIMKKLVPGSETSTPVAKVKYAHSPFGKYFVNSEETYSQELLEDLTDFERVCNGRTAGEYFQLISNDLSNVELPSDKSIKEVLADQRLGCITSDDYEKNVRPTTLLTETSDDQDHVLQDIFGE